MQRLLVVAVVAAALTGAPAQAQVEAWRVESVGEGTKPVLALSPQGAPRIAYMTEAEHGQVNVSSRDEAGWTQVTLSEGYFYGPLDFVIDDAGAGHIVYHDHQDGMFKPALGDAVYATDLSGSWELETILHMGHDGWDGSIAIGPDGQIEIASIDPSQFGSTDGVEWARRTDAGWLVSSVGSGPLPYEFATAIAIDATGATHVAYHEGSSRLDLTGTGNNLVYGRRSGSSATFMLEAVDLAGDVGKFASLALDAEQRPHLAYFERTASNSGFIKYAVREDDGTWRSDRVAAVDDVTIAFLGARRIVSLVMDAAGQPQLAWCDRSGLYHARPVAGSAGQWQVDFVTGPSPDMYLGQMASLSVDAAGRPHIAFYEVPQNALTSTGTIRYAVGAAPVQTAVGDLHDTRPAAFRLQPVYPNPFNQSTTISYELDTAGQVELVVFDLTGRRVVTLHQGRGAAGAHMVHWDGRDAAGRSAATGVYVVWLRHTPLQADAGAVSAAVRKLTLLQ